MTIRTERAPLGADRRFFALLAAAALAVVGAGFASSYYLWPLTRADRFAGGQRISPMLPAIVHVHAVLFSLWIVLLAVQAGLIGAGRAGAHRALGRGAAALVPLMLLTGALTAVQGARDGWNPGGPYRDALSFMFAGVADLAVFGTLTGAALLWRRSRDVHMRLMLLGTLGGLMWPAITRMPVVAGRLGLMFGLLAALVLAPGVRDVIVRARLRWLSVGVGAGILVTFLLRPLIGNSTAWRVVAAWLAA
jgi:uncharacterized membrane protein YozB (DUF420 family)